jgi:hypothetical protein
MVNVKPHFYVTELAASNRTIYANRTWSDFAIPELNGYLTRILEQNIPSLD